MRRLSFFMFALLLAFALLPAPARASVPVFPHQEDSELFLPLIASASDIVVEIPIPAGPFQMGCDENNATESCESDEQPVHTVTLDAYLIDKYEVTNARYKVCVEAGGCTLPGLVSSRTHGSYYDNPAYADFPVLWVTWSQGAAFCDWAGKRLPTEAEWEKAARGSNDTRTYTWGNSISTCAKANFDNGNPVIANYCVGDTRRVGSYPMGASVYGVMDMAGNVAEWNSDWYGSTYYATSPATNPTGPTTGIYRVQRGGSWSTIPERIRVASRYSRNLPVYWGYDTGFRCARSQ